MSQFYLLYSDDSHWRTCPFQLVPPTAPGGAASEIWFCIYSSTHGICDWNLSSFFHSPPSSQAYLGVPYPTLLSTSGTITECETLRVVWSSHCHCVHSYGGIRNRECVKYALLNGVYGQLGLTVRYPVMILIGELRLFLNAAFREQRVTTAKTIPAKV